MQIFLDAVDKIGLKMVLPNNSVMKNYGSKAVALHATKVLELLNGKFPVDEDYFSSMNSGESNKSFPLTDMQYSSMMGRNAGITLGGIATQYYFELDLYKVDIPELNDALNKILACHPMLNAQLIDGGRQRISTETASYTIGLSDLCHQDEIAQHEYIKLLRKEMTGELRPLEQAPPFNIHATQLSKEHIRLHLSFELLFMDLLSVKIMMRDWWAFYKNKDNSKKVAKFSFADHVFAEKKLFQSAQGIRDRAWWKNKLQQVMPAPELPLKQSPELIKNPQFSAVACVIPVELVNKLREICFAQGITLETLFLGCWIQTLRQWSQKAQFTLMITHHGRRCYSRDCENSIGNYLQSGLLNVNEQSTETLSERLIALQSEMILTRWHSSFNGVQALRELTQLSGTGRAVSMPVVFSNTLNAELRDISSDYNWEGTARQVFTCTQTPGVWLENQLLRINGELIMNWNVVDGLFPEGMIESMQEATFNLLQRCANEKEIWHKQRTLLPLPHNDALERNAANATLVDLKPQLLHRMVLNAAQKWPEKTAVLQGERQVTFAEIASMAYSTATAVQERHSIKPGDIVAVSLSQSPEMISAIIAVLLTGAAYVSIDPTLPDARKQRLIERCQAKALITNDDNAGWANCVAVSVQITDKDYVNVAFTPDMQQLDDLAYVIFTSGSTGEPKGVMVTHRNASNTVLDINRRFSVAEEDRVFSIAPAGFDLSVYDYFGVLGAGGSLVFHDPVLPNNPQSWAEQIVQHQITLWNSVPAPVKALIEQMGDSLGTSLRLILMSGDWIPVDLPAQIKAFIEGIDVVSLGGATEGSIWSIFYPIKEVNRHWKSIPYGKPLANQSFHVLNEWMACCPQWVTGELYIGGDGVALGYLGDVEKSAERFISHPVSGERLYRTGDLGRYIHDGLIEILGREDNQLKVNGYRIEPGEIEACLLKHELVSHVVIDAVPHPKTGQKQLAAWVVTSGGTIPEQPHVVEAQLRDLARAELPSYMIPTWLQFLVRMPLTANGKIDRKALPTPWLSKEVETKDEPADALESRLFDLWSEQLKHCDFNVNDGFFDIGGDSLHAVGILSAVRKNFNVSSVGEQEMIEGLFMNASIRDFARILTPVKGKEA
ncbi:amino acid adenylation domain-containing protein [Pantoea agglomerans]|uniref:non-ribosomal peptide synthetase n=1 Tax=Enterobacter agglomerans TaxID=549 RepID=UPI00320A98BA